MTTTRDPLQKMKATAPAGSAVRRPRRNRSRRICHVAGCDTILSTYNTSGACWLHTEPRPQPSYARTPRTSEIDPPRHVLTDEDLIALVANG
jgi:hypothetical protein